MWSWLLLVLAVASTAVAQDFLNELESFPKIIEELKQNANLTKCVPSLKMIDASGKIPNGIMYGNLIDLGNFDECLSVNEFNNETDETTLGKYCVVKIALPLTKFWPAKTFGLEMHHRRKRSIIQGMAGDNSTGLVIGWCIPHTCPINELIGAINDILERITPDIKILPIVDGICQTKDDLEVEFSTSDIIIIIFFSLTLLLIVLSTIYDIYIQHKGKKPAHILLIAFSVKTNGQKCLQVNNSGNQLSCIHGIRVISTIWVIYAHRYAVTIMSPWLNMKDLITWVNDPINMYILNGPVSVDTFFVMSGLLVSYVFCLAQNKGVKFNIILYYVHRYLRLTPVLAVVVWFHATLLPFMGSGPLWPLNAFNKQFCVDYWWAPLTYVQNYYNNENMCVGQTWYLSTDFQLFILSPILLLPLWKWPKYTMAACMVLLLGSMAIPFSISYVKDLASFTIQTAGNQDYNIYYYYGVHTRYGPWLMGFMLGYYLFKLQDDKTKKIKLCPYQFLIGWIVGLGLLVTVIFSGHDLMLHPTTLGNAFFNGCHRHGWALGICWVIFACSQGYGGPINAFLSWSVFQVLSKFSYTMYLTHLTLLYLMLSATRTVEYFTDFFTMYRFWGDFAFCLAISVCLTLAYESPMVSIEKVIFGRGEIKKNKEVQQEPKEDTPEKGQTNKGFVQD